MKPIITVEQAQETLLRDKRLYHCIVQGPGQITLPAGEYLLSDVDLRAVTIFTAAAHG